MKENTKKRIERCKVVAISRKVYGEPLRKLAAALNEGGIGLVEVTFDQADPDCVAKTGEAIAMLAECFGDALLPGAGTVTTVGQVEAAHRAGARYIISPDTNADVIARTLELGMVSMPGAMTPTEILAAHRAGADFVKLFPAASLGVPYAKDILSPINHVRLIATGGVDEHVLPDFLRLGFAGAGVGGRLTERKVIEEGNFPEFTRRARALMDVVGRCG